MRIQTLAFKRGSMQGIRLNFPTCPMVVLKGKHTIIRTGQNLVRVLTVALWDYARLEVKNWWFYVGEKREQSRELPAELP